jgi:hypothetical protein
MPCGAVYAGVIPVGAGFCPETTSGLDWHEIAARLKDTGGHRTRRQNAEPHDSKTDADGISRCVCNDLVGGVQDELSGWAGVGHPRRGGCGPASAGV